MKVFEGNFDGKGIKKHVREFGNWSKDRYFFTCLDK